jgi:hypothetical protein
VPALFTLVCILDKIHRSLASRASFCLVGRLLCVKVNHVQLDVMGREKTARAIPQDTRCIQANSEDKADADDI